MDSSTLNQSNSLKAHYQQRSSALPRAERLACYPPLDRITVLKETEVEFTVVLEIPQTEQISEVSLYHSEAESDWKELRLNISSPNHTPTDLQPASATDTGVSFSGILTIVSSCCFTVRYKLVSSKLWHYAKDEWGYEDGTVIVCQSDTISSQLQDYLPHLDEQWSVSKVLSQSPGTSVWTMKFDVDGTKADISTYTILPIGVPFGGYCQWFCLVRKWPEFSPWLEPRQGRCSFESERPAIFCAFMGPHGKHMVLLGVHGVNHVSPMFIGGKDRVAVHVRSDGESSEACMIIVSVGSDFSCTVAAAMYHARSLVPRGKLSTADMALSDSNPSSDAQAQSGEAWYDGLGFCTWNSIGQELTEEKVFNALDKLAESKISISHLIIDDNWQTIHHQGDSQFQSGWVEFEAEPKSFPNGLKHAISHIRRKHPQITYIVVWHALLGYWGGISPTGKLAKRYKTARIEQERSTGNESQINGEFTVVDKEDVMRLYDEFYTFLSSCGINGVKTDVQFNLDAILRPEPRRRLIKEYLDAWKIASLRHFRMNVISCMSQVPEIMFYSQLPQDTPSKMLFRNSDDYFPDIPDSHTWHVWTNAHNSVFTQHLHVVPDWDMFQTMHEYSAFHAAARCVSGAPIYITDVPGSHNIGLIQQFTGVTPRGNTVTFRPSAPGKSIDAYTQYHERALLKIGVYHGSASIGTPMLGIFNVTGRPETEIIPLSSFPGVVSTHSYVVRSHTSQKISNPLSPASLLLLKLDIRGYDILTAYSLSTFSIAGRGSVMLANLGLVEKMSGAAAIVASTFVAVTDSRLMLDTKLKALGVLGIYISDLPQLTISDNFIATIQGKTIPPHTVSIYPATDHVLAIDTEKAWAEMELQTPWSNELQLKLYVNFAPTEMELQTLLSNDLQLNIYINYEPEAAHS